MVPYTLLFNARIKPTAEEKTNFVTTQYPGSIIQLSTKLGHD